MRVLVLSGDGRLRCGGPTTARVYILVHAVRARIAKLRIVLGQIADVLERNVWTLRRRLGLEIGVQVVHGRIATLIDLHAARTNTHVDVAILCVG